MRNVRPSWIDCEIDGRSSTLSGGPRSRTGNLLASFKVRENGQAKECLTVRLTPNPAGTETTLQVYNGEGFLIFSEEFVQ
jgi:hypothetical protein